MDWEEKNATKKGTDVRIFDPEFAQLTLNQSGDRQRLLLCGCHKLQLRH
jgi:hypothetical protein